MCSKLGTGLVLDCKCAGFGSPADPVSIMLLCFAMRGRTLVICGTLSRSRPVTLSSFAEEENAGSQDPYPQTHRRYKPLSHQPIYDNDSSISYLEIWKTLGAAYGGAVRLSLLPFKKVVAPCLLIDLPHAFCGWLSTSSRGTRLPDPRAHRCRDIGNPALCMPY